MNALTIDHIECNNDNDENEVLEHNFFFPICNRLEIEMICEVETMVTNITTEL